MSTNGRSMATALRIRVSMSAIGSVIIESPARLLHSGNQTVERQAAEAQPAQLELAVHRSRAAAQLAAPLAAATELGLAVRFFDFRLAGHCERYSELSGSPSSWSNSRASSSRSAVVTREMCMP